MPNPSIKDEDTYQALRDQGASKEKAARIANARAAGDHPSSKGGKAPPYEEWTVEELRDRARELRPRRMAPDATPGSPAPTLVSAAPPGAAPHAPPRPACLARPALRFAACPPAPRDLAPLRRGRARRTAAPTRRLHHPRSPQAPRAPRAAGETPGSGPTSTRRSHARRHGRRQPVGNVAPPPGAPAQRQPADVCNKPRSSRAPRSPRAAGATPRPGRTSTRRSCARRHGRRSSVRGGRPTVAGARRRGALPTPARGAGRARRPDRPCAAGATAGPGGGVTRRFAQAPGASRPVVSEGGAKTSTATVSSSASMAWGTPPGRRRRGRSRRPWSRPEGRLSGAGGPGSRS